MTRLYSFVSHRPRLALSLVAFVSLAAVFAIVDVPNRTLRLQIVTAVDKILPHGSPDRAFYEDFQKRFGADNLIYVGLILDEGHVFTTERLDAIQRMAHRIEKVDGVERVVGLSNVSDIRSEDGDVVSAPIFEEVPTDPAELERLHRHVMNHPLHVGRVVAPDASAVAFLVFPEEMSEREFRQRGIDLEVERAARQESPPGSRVVLAGGPPIKAETSRTLLRDLLTFLPAGYCLMALVGWLAFRTKRGVVLPLVSITIGILWTFGVMAISGRSLNLVTFIVPALIQAVGFAYAVHVVAEHDEVVREGNVGPGAALEGLRRVAFPVMLTAVTTAAGFMSLTMSRIPAIREFGFFCTVGVFSSMIAALVFVPAIQSLLRLPAGGRDSSPGAFERWVTRLGEFDVRHRSAILATGGLLGVIAILAMSQIHVSTSFVDNLMPGHPLRRAIEAFDERLTGSMTIHLVLDTGESDAFKDPGRLRTLREFQAWIESQPEVGVTTSIADYVMTVNRAFNQNDPAAFAIPDSASLIGKYFFFFWDQSLEALVDSNFSSADVQIRGPYLDSHGAVALLDRIEAKAASLSGFKAGTTGSLAVIARTMDEIAWGQARSLTGASGIIFVILALYFRSIRVAAWALVPNLLPVVVYFGLLGLTGITLNVITSLIACIVLGIAVDDTIHFLVRYRELTARGQDDESAAVEALRNVARPVTTTSAALCGGFSVLMASGLRHQVEFGVLATALLAFAWLVDMTLTPALASRLKLAGGTGDRRGPRP